MRIENFKFQIGSSVALVALLLVSQPSTLNAQPSASNRVLELDGTNSFLELPPAMLEGLEQVTIEGWVKWHKQGEWTRFFTLALSRRFCEMMGGELTVESAYGKGSSFTVTLPMQAPEGPGK